MRPNQILLSLKPTIFCLILASATTIFGQATTFTYQGRLQDGITNANGTYDFQFTLWDLLSGGTQQPQPSPVTVTRSGVAVAAGVFTVQLDFGANAFPGAARFIEIGVKPASGGTFTPLSPRQPITATPYAVRSLNAASADNVTVSGIPAGSTNYIQNTTAQQASSNFNISGNGTIGGNLSIGNCSSCFAARLTVGGNDPTGIETISTASWGIRARSSGFGFAAVFGDHFGAYAGVIGRGRLGTMGISGSESSTYNHNQLGLSGILGTSSSGVGVSGVSDSNVGVAGKSASSDAGNFDSNTGRGIYAHSTSNYAVFARSENTHAIYAQGSVKFDRWLELGELRGGSGTHVCWDGTNLSNCSSSLRYKKNIGRFSAGLDLVRRLSPITFDWKQGEMHDLGLGAEDVEKIEPLLVNYNKDGKVEGVKYDRISVVLINAVKEQQAEIESQREQIKLQHDQIKRQEDHATQHQASFAAQQEQLKQQRSLIEQQAVLIDNLRRLVCRRNARATICRR